MHCMYLFSASGSSFFSLSFCYYIISLISLFILETIHAFMVCFYNFLNAFYLGYIIILCYACVVLPNPDFKMHNHKLKCIKIVMIKTVNHHTHH